MREESRLRLEKAMAKLAEASEQHDERLAATEQTNQRLERTTQILHELVTDHHKLMANMQRRVTGLEEARATVAELLRRHQDGMTELRAAQADSDAKIAALADAQICGEETMNAMKVA